MDQQTLESMATDPSAFRKHLVINTEQTKFGGVIEPWQDADFRAMDAALLEAAGRKPYDPATIRYSWSERPRGHSKTFDVATNVAWFLIFARGPYTVIVAASDRDQAKLVRDALDKIVKLNEWIGELITVQSYDAIGRNGSKLKIMSADVGSSFGEAPRLVIVDEVCHWPEATGEELWGSLFSSAGKSKECAVFSISNAGMIGTWSHKLRERIRGIPSWRFSRLDGPMASWITPEMLSDQQKLLLPKQYERLWLNNWTDAEGDALESALIDAALRGDVPPLEAPEKGYTYVCGLDVGLTKDGTSLAILGKHHSTKRLRLAQVRTWKPTKGKSISLEEVERELIELHRQFRFAKIFIDQWQTQQMIERLKARMISVDGVFVNSAMYGKMARTLLSIFGDGMIQLFNHVELIRDLRAISLIESPPGNIRIQLPHTESGHCDTAMSLLLAMEAAKEANTLPYLATPIARPGVLHAASPSPFPVPVDDDVQGIVWASWSRGGHPGFQNQ
ncbi:hypothetical protein K2Y11_21270 [bacterium]|nr:hypothetical protein [bacterium]